MVCGPGEGRRGRMLERLESPLDVSVGLATLYRADCFEWLAAREPCSVHAIVTDPPYGLVDYTAKEQGKLRAGMGGVWRIPPSFDGHKRSPLPRFTVLTDADRKALYGAWAWSATRSMWEWRRRRSPASRHFGR